MHIDYRGIYDNHAVKCGFTGTTLYVWIYSNDTLCVDLP